MSTVFIQNYSHVKSYYFNNFIFKKINGGVLIATLKTFLDLKTNKDKSEIQRFRYVTNIRSITCGKGPTKTWAKIGKEIENQEDLEEEEKKKRKKKGKFYDLASAKRSG